MCSSNHFSISSQFPCFSRFKFFRFQDFQGPGFSGSRFSGSGSRVRVQVLEVAFFNQNSNQIKVQKNQYNVVFINKKGSFISPRLTMERLLCVVLRFTEVLTGFSSNLHKADTCLQRIHQIGPVGDRYTQVQRFHKKLSVYT